jgi:hypothetical protein
MKRILFCSLLMIHTAASSVEKGASRAAVTAELGEPDGSMQRDGKEILLFKTGTVTLQNDAVTEADISQENARQAEERALKARELRAKELAALEQQKRLCPEDHIVEIHCTYNKIENLDILPEAVRPTPGNCRYDVYIPLGYYDSTTRGYPCLILESPALWAGVKEIIYKEKWIAVILRDAVQGPVGKTMNRDFLATYDDATERFRISKSKIFLAGRTPSAIFATMRPVAGIILQDPNFIGLEGSTYKPDFLRKNPDLRAYALLGNKDRDNIIFQGNFIKKNFPKHYIGVYEGGEALLPRPLANGAISWMKKEYSIP